MSDRRPPVSRPPLNAERLATLTNELNNLLTVIEGYARLSGAQLPPESPVQEHLEEIMRAATHAADLARELGRSRAAARPEPPPVERTPAAPPGAPTHRVLLVEDDRAVRLFTAAILRLNGFAVTAAESGPEALELCERAGGAFELVLTDVVMAPMDGVELVGRLRERWPEIKVLMISGYPGEVVEAVDARGEPLPLLNKPFTTFELMGRLRELLEHVAAKDQSASGAGRP